MKKRPAMTEAPGRLAISHIAWPQSEEVAIAPQLARWGISGIEVAPTKVWGAPLRVAQAEVDRYRRFWADQGTPIVAAQSLLYGCPDLSLFRGQEALARTEAYLFDVVEVCARLGARTLVFGSPRNRRRDGLAENEAQEIARGFFSRLAEAAWRNGAVIGLEANPVDYGADFVTTAREAIALVRDVAHPGLRWHVDAACLHLAGESPAATVPSNADLLAHVHVSEPFLAPFGSGGVDHDAVAASLRAAAYRGWVSIEMRPMRPFSLDGLRACVDRAVDSYCTRGTETPSARDAEGTEKR